MKTIPNTKLKLLILGAFIAFTSTAFGQSTPYVYFPASNDVTISACQGDTVAMAALSFTGNTTFEWEFIPFGQSTGTTISNTAQAEAYEEGTYRCYEYDGSGSLVGQNDLSPTFNELSVSLTASNQQTRYAQVSNGTELNTATPTNNQPVGVFGYYTQNRALRQFLITANELTAGGLYPGAPLKSISFFIDNVTSNYDGSPTINDFKIKIIPTTKSDLSSGWESGAGTEVYSNYWLYSWNYGSGWNEFDFNQTITWDGTSNIVVEVSYMHSSNSTTNEEDHSFRHELKSSVRSRFTTNSTAISLASTNGFLPLTQTSNYVPNIKFKTAQKIYENQVVFCDDSGTLEVGSQLISTSNGNQGLSNSLLSYEWSNGSVTPTLAVSTAGEYWVKVTHTNLGCTSIDTAQVSFSSLDATISASASSVCTGSAISLTIDNEDISNSYAWSTGELTSSINVIEGSSISLIETDTSGCVNSQSLDIYFQNSPKVLVPNNQAPSYVGQNLSGTYANTSVYLGEVEGHHYYMIQNPVSWETARSACESLGGNLFIPNSKYENDAVDQLIVDKNARAEAWLGIYWNGSEWVDANDEQLEFSYWWGSESGQSNISQPYSTYPYTRKDHWNGSWYNQATTDNRYFIIEFGKKDSELVNNQTFCDEVELKASSFLTTYKDGFSQVYWKDENGTVLDSGEFVTFDESATIQLEGVFTQSNGQDCSLQSSLYSFIIADSPVLEIVNVSSTTDLYGNDTIVLIASSDQGTVSWEDESGNVTNNDTLLITGSGVYTAKAVTSTCTSTSSITIHQPIFVSKDGDDTSGDGTFDNPYLTISKAYQEVSSGGKIYVLPGTYLEEFVIDKPVLLASDYLRLDSIGAIESTIIKASNGKYAISIDPTATLEKPIEIIGFTFTGKTDNQHEAALDVFTAPSYKNEPMVHLKNLIFENNSVQWGWSEPAAALSVRNSSSVKVENTLFKDNNPSQLNNPSVVSLQYSSEATFKNCRFEGNYSDYSIISLWNGDNTLNLENTYFYDNIAKDGFIRARGWGNKVNANHITINEAGNVGVHVFVTEGNSILSLKNSVVNATNNGTYLWYGESNSSASFNNNILNVQAGRIHTSTSTSGYSFTDCLDANPQINVDGTLKSNSPAIGSATIGLSTDIDGNSRPNPVGSNPDAGAFESVKAIGDFYVEIVSCGYGLNASVYNSDNYSVEWVFGGNVVSTEESFTASNKGVYTLNVYSVDRSDTIIKTHSLNNPLTMEILDVSNSCEFISSSNGKVTWGNVKGGTQYSTDWWTYKTAVRNESGTQIDGYWHLSNGETWNQTKSNLSPGKYYFFVDDATGCEVGDTIEILNQEQSTYYVSTTGDDLNGGLSEIDAFATIKRAVQNTCKGDSVIVLDGTYFEDSIHVESAVVIGSKFLIDGDSSHIHNTIIDGSSSNYILAFTNPNYSSYTWADTTYSRLEGLTLQNALTTNGDYGGAVTLWNNRTLLINRVVFKDNKSNRGAGIYQRDWARLSLTNTVFEGNTATSSDGGAFYSDNGYLVIKNNRFQNNQCVYNGGAFYLNSPRSLVLNDNILYGNQASNGASGMFASLCCVPASMDINNLQVLNGTGQYPILIHQSQSNWITFKNLLIAGNNSTQAEAMQIQDGSSKVRLVNATIVNNSLSNGASGFFRADWGDVDLVVWNSILDANDATSILNDNTCNNYNLTIANSFVNLTSSSAYDNNCGTTNITYTSNITSGSYYEDLASGNYAPSNISSVLGAGSASATVAGSSLASPAKDLFGNTRPSPSGTSPDLGAIESSESTPQMGMLTVVENNGFCETNSGSITVNLLNYSGAATYEWKSLTDATWSWNSTQTASNLVNGTYRAIALDNSTSAKLDSVDVVISNSPIISITNQSSSVACNGELNGQLEFNIDGGNPFGSSMYQYTIEYLESASIADGFVVDQDGWHFTSDNNSSNRSNSFKSNNYAEAFRNGYYEVTVTDEDGCSVTDTLTLDYLYDLPEVTITTLSSDNVAGLTSMCSGTGNTISLTADVTGGGGTNTYAWSNSSTAQTIGVAQTDEYYVEVTDQNTCVGRDTIDIVFQTQPLVYVGAPATKTGEAISDFVYLGEYQDHHYYYYTLTHNYTWDQAKSVAEGMGAYLWSVNSRAEHEAVAAMYQSQNQVCCEAFLGAYKEGGQWKWHSGEPFIFTNWSQNEPSDPNGETRIRIQWGWWDNQNVPGLWEDYGHGQAEQKFIFEFPSTQQFLSFNESFCDSVKVFAGAQTGIGFDSYVWVDSSTDTIGTGASIMVSQDLDFKVYGQFVRSDGQTCDLASSDYSIDINNSPNLEITALSGTYDFANGDTLYFLATSDTTSASVTWSNSTSTDTLMVTSLGDYTATAEVNGCSVSRSFRIEEAIYVAKTGSNLTGNGSLSAPYKTIQFAIDTASEGSKIYVLPGTYNENLLIDKNLRIYSDYVRLGNKNAINNTVINAGLSGRIVEFASGITLNAESMIIDGFTMKNGNVGYDEGSGIYAHWNPGTGITIKNSVLSNNAKQCCANGIAISMSGVDLYLENVDIKDNGSPIYWDERIIVELRHLTTVWKNVKFRGNESNSDLLHFYDVNAEFTNSDFVSNSIQDNNAALISLGGVSKLSLNHVTMANNFGQGYGIRLNDNYDQKLIVFNSVIDGFGLGSIKTAGASNSVYLVNSLIDNVPGSVIGNAPIYSTNSLEVPTPGVTQNGLLQSTSPAIGLGGADTTIAGTVLAVPEYDLAGKQRPLPLGSNPDAGAYEDSLSVGKFGIAVADCGYNIDVTVLNSEKYGVSITSSNGFTSNQQNVTVNLKGTYLVSVTDSISGSTISKTVQITNPLTIGYLWSKDACASNGGYGEIRVGDFHGGTRYNIPNDQYWAYSLDIYDSTGSNLTNWNVPDYSGHYNDLSVQAGEYVVVLTDGSGCSVYDTVVIEETIGSRYYISTTGSDTADGTLSGPLSTIQEALGRACDGDTIVLLDGEYFENVEMNSTSPMVTIASEMILDADSSHITLTIVNGMDEDPVFDINDKSSSSHNVVLYGFTVTNGKSNSNWWGGGGISAKSSDIELENMIISGNRSGNSGGGIGMDYCELLIKNTIIEDNIANSSGGGIFLQAVSKIDAVGRVVIRNNRCNSDGGGIGWAGHWDSELSLSNFIIENNQAQWNGGGLYVTNYWGGNSNSVKLENLKITNNRSINAVGGAYINGSGNDLVLSNTIVAFNKSNSIGGLQIENTDIDVVHTTVYKNTVLNGSTSNDQIKLNNNANVVFLNSAVGGQEAIGASTAHTFYLDDYDTTCDLTISNSIISGGINSIDNPYSSTITGTPIGQALYLVDPANGDYMLSPVSAGLGAGASFYSGVTIPAVDYFGNARPGTAGQDPDIGAVESPLDSASFGAAYEIRNNIACDPTYGRLKVIPLNGSGSYKYELDDLTGTATFNDQQNVPSYTYSSLYSGDYLVTITDLSTLAAYTDTVSITGKDSLSLTKNISNEFCAGEANGSITLRVSGGDGYYDYTWSTATYSGYPKSSTLNNLSPEEYFVTVKDGDNCFIEDSVTIVTLHSIPTVAITGEINKAGTIVTSTNPQIRACAGDEVTLDAGAGFVTYNWTTIDQLNSWTTQTLDASYEQGFYVTVIDSFGCTNSDTAEVFYVQAPAVFASNVNTNIGAAMQSVTSYVEGASQSLGDSYYDAKPYGAGDAFAKMQFIIPASELIAEGLTDQTTINSIGFEVSVETGSPIQNFKVKMKNTTANQLNSNFETGLTQVYSLNILTPGEGWNTHTFDEGFVWDGTKNLLVQVEYSNIAFSGGSDHLLMGADMSYDATAVAKGSSSVQNSTSSDFRSTWRPNMKFGIDKVQATDTLRVCDFTMLNTTDDYDTYSWMVNNVSQSSLLRYSVNSPLEVVLKTVDAASSCTMYSDTVQVLLDTTPTVFVSNNALVGCIGDSLTVGIDSLDSEVNYSWSNGVMDTVGLFTESGQYYVYATSPSGCQGVDTVSVDINIPPDVVVELNGRVLTSTDGSLVADNSSCDTTLILPYYTMVDTLSMLGSSEWSTYSDEYLTWEYQQGWDSLVDFTGPTYDADSNFYGGFYQFDPASLTDQNKVGYLQLGCVNLLGMGSPELTFDYHMVDVYADSANTSDQMGSLELQVKAAGDDNWTTVWQRSGTEASYDWVTKSLSLSAYVNKTIQLRWKGVAGVGGPRSEMALDNIGINDSLALLSNVAGRATPETVCEGDSLFANTVSNGTTNFSFAWNTGDTTSAVELHNSGWYAVTVMDEKNCMVTSDSVYIEVNPAPNNMLAVSDTMQYCEGVFDSLMISAEVGYDHYQWYSNYGSGYVEGDTTSAIEVDSIVTGTQSFYVMITDSLGCRSTAEAVDIVQTPTPQLVLTSNDVLCNSDSTGSVDVMATGSGSWNYSWSTGDTLSSIGAIPTGWYTVSVVDTFTCSTVDSIFVGEPSAVALAVQSTIDVDCYGSNTGSADISFTGGVGGYTYSWTDTTGTWSSSNEDLNFAPAGKYFVTAQDSNGCSLSDTVSITEPTELVFSVDSILDLTCKGNMDGYIGVSASGGMMPYTFIANNDTNTTGEFYNLDSNYYVLTVLDSNGCTVVDGAVVSQPDPPFDGEEICIVTVDTSGVNLVVWEKTPQKRTSEYIILRENTSTQYVSIGTNQYNDMSTFADQNSNPAVQPYRYRLALMDSCGFYSDTSGYHATIHLQASQGVASNEVQLQWTAYEGKTVQTYYIYRWLSPTNRVLIDSVSSNVQTYTDIYPVNTAITALIYEVSAKFVNGSCSPTMNKKAPYEGSFSNKLDWGNDSGLPIGTDEWVNTVLEHNLEIFPNPTLGILNLDLKGAWEEQRNIRIAVTDLTGRVLAKDVVHGAGRTSFDFRELPAGIYFIQIITDEGRTIVKRFERVN